MLSLRKKLRLYVITDRRFKDEIETVKEALAGGATSIQLRMKGVPTREMIEIGREIRKLTTGYNALYFVDDRLDVALATNADGVQLGIEDMPISLVRSIAPNLVIGASVYDLKGAIRAEKEGADYLGAGAVFPTSTKVDVKVMGLKELGKVINTVEIPVIAIGGINHKNVKQVLKLGVDGIATISAIVGAPNVKKATQEMERIISEFING